MILKPNQTIETLAPYALADLSVPKNKPLISLAQNELCFTPSRQVIAAVSKAACDAHLYPDADWIELTNAIAEVHNLNSKQILCGAGSMELLEVIGRVYLSTNDQVVMSEYGYSFFKTVAKMYGAEINIAPEKNFTADIELLVDQVSANTKIVFLANPANPTGTLVSANEIRRLRALLEDSVLLILDEAYAEFTDPHDYTPLFDLVNHGNTVVLRTFSKIYGLAGMRVGWGYFPEHIYRSMRKVLNPNNISALSQAAAATTIQQQQVVKHRKHSIDAIKSAFRSDLNALSLSVPESHSNFVLIDFDTQDKSQYCFNRLKEQGIIMRPMDAYGLSQCLRATISSEQNMQITIKHLTQILKGYQS